MKIYLSTNDSKIAINALAAVDIIAFPKGSGTRSGGTDVVVDDDHFDINFAVRVMAQAGARKEWLLRYVVATDNTSVFFHGTVRDWKEIPESSIPPNLVISNHTFASKTDAERHAQLLQQWLDWSNEPNMSDDFDHHTAGERIRDEMSGLVLPQN